MLAIGKLLTDGTDNRPMCPLCRHGLDQSSVRHNERTLSTQPASMTRWLFGVGPCLVLSRLEGGVAGGPGHIAPSPNQFQAKHRLSALAGRVASASATRAWHLRSRLGAVEQPALDEVQHLTSREFDDCGVRG